MRFPTQLHTALDARKSAFALAAGFFLVPSAMPCETAFSTALSVTPFFTAFRTAISIFLTALVCFLAIVQFLRSEDDLQLGIVHGRFPFVAGFPRSWHLRPRTFRKCDFKGSRQAVRVSLILLAHPLSHRKTESNSRYSGMVAGTGGCVWKIKFWRFFATRSASSSWARCFCSWVSWRAASLQFAVAAEFASSSGLGFSM